MDEEKIQPYDESHYVFKNNPTKMKSYVHKEVRVTTDNGETVGGFVQAIDPVSGSIVLITLDRQTPTRATIIMGHSVKSITVTNADVPEELKFTLDKLVKPLEHNMKPNEIQSQKEKVKLWMSKHRISFEEDKESGELNFMNVLVLKVPYTAGCCVSANEIVLGKIQGLLKAMPSDIESW